MQFKRLSRWRSPPTSGERNREARTSKGASSGLTAPDSESRREAAHHLH